MNDNTKKIKKITEDFIKRISADVQINVLPIKDSTVFIEIKTQNPQIFIGQGSEALAAAQHLLRAILKKTFDNLLYVDLDVNGYKKIRKEYLKELAVSTANEVSLSKRAKTLAPMNSYERRVIHMELSQRPDVVTESGGQGIDRKVTIKPASSPL